MLLRSAWCAQPSRARVQIGNTLPMLIICPLSPLHIWPNNFYWSAKWKKKNLLGLIYIQHFTCAKKKAHRCPRVITHEKPNSRVAAKLKKQSQIYVYFLKRCRKSSQGSFRSNMWDGKRLSRQTPAEEAEWGQIYIVKKNKHRRLSIYITTPTSRKRFVLSSHPSSLYPSPQPRSIRLNI